MENRSVVNVLVVDDDSSFAEMTEMFLEQVNSSFAVTIRNSGTEGVAYLESNQVDCIVCDYEMPGMDGLDVLEEVRSRSDVPFILFTGRGSEEVASEAFSKGATDYLQKEGSRSTYELLSNRIEKYVEKQELYDEQARIIEEKNRLLDRVNDAYMSYDEEFRFMHLNERGVELIEAATGREFEYDDLVGECLWEIVPEAVGTQFEDEYRAALASGEEREFESYYEDMDAWFGVRAFPSEDGVSVFVRDITERKKSECEREREIEVLFDLYEIASDASLSSDERLSKAVRLGRDFLDVSFGFITEISDGVQEIMLAETTVSNSQLQEGAVCPIDETYCQNVLDTQQMVAVSEASKSDVIDDNAFERFALESYISQRVFVEDEVFGTLCFADFESKDTEFSEVEQAIAELLAGWVGFEIERMLHRERLEAQNERLEAFAGFVSHDLRNPLSVAEGYIDLELEERADSSERLRKVSDAHKRIDAIISELLAFARSSDELTERSDVSIQTMASDAWSNVTTGESSLRVETDMIVEADCGKLLNVFENLFRNSIEHNESAVTVVVDELESGDGFYIEDDGVGVPDGVNLFSYDSESASNRLGLLISQEIVTAHGWSIEHVPCESGCRVEVQFK